jgi:hypothetical protein
LLATSGDMEDVRLFRWRDALYATANVRTSVEREQTFRPCLLSLRYASGRLAVTERVVLDRDNGLDDPWGSEKNWCPLIDDSTGDLYLTRYFKPRVLYRYDPATKSISRAYSEPGSPSAAYRSPSAPIRVQYGGMTSYLGVAHIRRDLPRNYEYASTYETKFYLLKPTYPFELVEMTPPLYFNCYPQGFLYPFQIVQDTGAISLSVIVSVNIHDSKTVLFRVPLEQIFRNFDARHAATPEQPLQAARRGSSSEVDAGLEFVHHGDQAP